MFDRRLIINFDWATLIENKDKEIDRLNKAYIRNLEGAGAELIMERAEILDRNTVRLASGRKITAKYILIATGAAPFIPRHLPGHELAISSNEAFHLEKLPRRICIVGGGYIAVEYGHFFAAMGTKVIIVEMADRMVIAEEPEISRVLGEELSKLLAHLSPRESALLQGIASGSKVVIKCARGEIRAVATVTKRLQPLSLNGHKVHQIALPCHWGYMGLSKGDSANILTARVCDVNTMIPEYRAFLCEVRKA